MPQQQKINFKGSRIDPRMPKILKGTMEREEWDHFVWEIDRAIYEAQSSMRFSPWLILALTCFPVILIIMDLAVKGLFGNPEAGTITLTVFVILGILVICYVSMCRPSRTVEEWMEIICDEYTDEEREIYFFYRHHANTRITENRFYIECFVGKEDDIDAPPMKSGARKLDTEEPLMEDKNVEWEPDIVGEEDDEEHMALVPYKPPQEESRALVPHHDQKSSALVPSKKDDDDLKKALVPKKVDFDDEKLKVALIPVEDDEDSTKPRNVWVPSEPGDEVLALVPLGLDPDGLDNSSSSDDSEDSDDDEEAARSIPAPAPAPFAIETAIVPAGFPPRDAPLLAKKDEDDDDEQVTEGAIVPVRTRGKFPKNTPRMPQLTDGASEAAEQEESRSTTAPEESRSTTAPQEDLSQAMVTAATAAEAARARSAPPPTMDEIKAETGAEALVPVTGAPSPYAAAANMAPPTAAEEEQAMIPVVAAAHAVPMAFDEQAFVPAAGMLPTPTTEQALVPSATTTSGISAWDRLAGEMRDAAVATVANSDAMPMPQPPRATVSPPQMLLMEGEAAAEVHQEDDEHWEDEGEEEQEQRDESTRSKKERL